MVIKQANPESPLLRVTDHRGLDGLLALEADWRRLTATDDRYTMNFDWFVELVRHGCRTSTELLFLAVRDERGQAVAIVPLEFWVEQLRRVSINAWILVGTRYGDVLWCASTSDFPCESPELATVVVRCVKKHLCKTKPAAGLLILGRVAEGSAAFEGCRNNLGRFGSHRVGSGWKWLSVSSGFDARMAQLDSRFRSSLRSSMKKLNAEGVVTYTRSTAGEPTFRSDYQEFLDLEAGGWKGKNGSQTALAVSPVRDYANFIDSLIQRPEACSVEIHSLRVNGRSIASQLWLRRGSVRAMLKVSYNEAYSKLRPGHLVVSNVIEQACADPTMTIIDFISEEEWFDRWRPIHSPYHSFFLPLRNFLALVPAVLLTLPTRGDLAAWLKNALPRRKRFNQEKES